MKQLEFSHIARENMKQFEKKVDIFLNTKHLLYCPFISFLDIYPREVKPCLHKNTLCGNVLKSFINQTKPNLNVHQQVHG